MAFKLGTEVLPGIESWATGTWHLPGHSAFVLPAPADGGAPGPFVFAGDAAGHVQLSVENPTAVHVFDTFPERGARQRVRLMHRLAKTRARVVFAHAAFPGIGGLSVGSKRDKTFVWKPLPWNAS